MSKVPVAAPYQFPWDAIVFVESTFPDGSFEDGSGVIVGPNDVLTAAHVIYEADHGGTATNINVAPAFEPAPFHTPFGVVNAATYQIPPAYFLHPISSTAGTVAEVVPGAEHDVALLDLAVPLGNRTGWMGLDPNFSNGRVHETGYPEHYHFAMMDDVASVQHDATYNFLNATNLEAWPGDSGGPLWYLDANGTAEVVGLTSIVSFDLNKNPTGQAFAAYDVSTDYNFLTAAIANNDFLIA